MDCDTIIRELEDHIRRRYGIDENDEDFGVDVHLFDYGYVDSIGAAALIAHIEQTYGVQVTDRDIRLYPMNTLREIARFIEAKRRGQR